MPTPTSHLPNFSKAYLLPALLSMLFVGSLFVVDEGVGLNWVNVPAERMMFLLFSVLLFGTQIFFSKIILKKYKGNGRLIISIFGSMGMLLGLLLLLGLVLTIVQ